MKHVRTVTKEVDRVCANCGHRKRDRVTLLNGVRPNTNQKIIKGFLGPLPGTWLGCKLGNHDYYYDYELGVHGGN